MWGGGPIPALRPEGGGERREEPAPVALWRLSQRPTRSWSRGFGNVSAQGCGWGGGLSQVDASPGGDRRRYAPHKFGMR